ncbi:hypothetical protein [Heyndrickxia sporothermodurans]
MADKMNDAAGNGGGGTAVPYCEQFCRNCYAWIEFSEPAIVPQRDESGRPRPVQVIAGGCHAKPPTIGEVTGQIDAVWPTTQATSWCAAWRDGGAR